MIPYNTKIYYIVSDSLLYSCNNKLYVIKQAYCITTLGEASY